MNRTAGTQGESDPDWGLASHRRGVLGWRGWDREPESVVRASRWAGVAAAAPGGQRTPSLSSGALVVPRLRHSSPHSTLQLPPRSP